MAEFECSPEHPADGSITWFFHQLRDGDDGALAPLWQRYFPRLMGLARRVFADRQQRMASAEDAVQEALVSFWRRARSGEFADVSDRDHLWQLLAQFTVYRVHHQIRQQAAQKRGSGRVLDEAALHAQMQSIAELARATTTPELDLLAAELLEMLPVELREFALLRLLGYSTAEIATRFDCTQRKVQRKLKLVQLHWERLQPEK